MRQTVWAILTGEYPPQPGGVSDYTRQVAAALAEAGDEVHVWASPCDRPDSADPGVTVRRLPDRFGPRSLCRLGGALRRLRPDRLLVQYVPQMYGYKAMNLPFCQWLTGRRDPAPWVMFHEVYFPCGRGQALRHNALGVVTHVMARLVVRAARRAFVSIPAWEGLLREVGLGRKPVTWLPVPSNVPTRADRSAVAEFRARVTPDAGSTLIGHFSTYGGAVAEQLGRTLPRLLRADPRRVGLLVGRGGRPFAERLLRDCPSLRGRLHPTGEVSPDEIAAHLRACDLLVQPYPDGVSGRRTSLMAGLALGVPTVTTHGELTEPLWREEGLVEAAPAGDPDALAEAGERLLADPKRLTSLGRRGAEGYRNHFSLDRTVRTLRELSLRTP